MFRATAGAAAAFIAAPLLTACWPTFGSGAPPCMPPAYTVTPDRASVGERITVSAPDATCDPRYGAGAQIEVTVVDAAGREVVRVLAPMRDAGGFSLTFEVPADTAEGRGHVSAYPYGLDWCDDTGTNNRLRRAAGTTAGRADAVVLASCAVREVPLTVGP
ncbi:hypothetical protein [Sinomonas mesophila]|uniref:hypothetical protein n=1 Tax=Sinomonas mesophila TaxID=1531955 RepID=UPI00158C3AAA|nr:hypothetical protein [Sinomonas mesophila]